MAELRRYGGPVTLTLWEKQPGSGLPQVTVGSPWKQWAHLLAEEKIMSNYQNHSLSKRTTPKKKLKTLLPPPPKLWSERLILQKVASAPRSFYQASLHWAEATEERRHSDSMLFYCGEGSFWWSESFSLEVIVDQEKTHSFSNKTVQWATGRDKMQRRSSKSHWWLSVANQVCQTVTSLRNQ